MKSFLGDVERGKESSIWIYLRRKNFEMRERVTGRIESGDGTKPKTQRAKGTESALFLQPIATQWKWAISFGAELLIMRFFLITWNCPSKNHESFSSIKFQFIFN